MSPQNSALCMYPPPPPPPLAYLLGSPPAPINYIGFAGSSSQGVEIQADFNNFQIVLLTGDSLVRADVIRGVNSNHSGRKSNLAISEFLNPWIGGDLRSQDPETAPHFSHSSFKR